MTQETTDPGPPAPPIPPTPPRPFSYAQSLGGPKSAPFSPPVPPKPPTKQFTLDALNAPVQSTSFFGQGSPPPPTSQPAQSATPAASLADTAPAAAPTPPPKPKGWGAFKAPPVPKTAEPVAPAPAPAPQTEPEPSQPAAQAAQSAREQAPSPPPYEFKPQPPPANAWSQPRRWATSQFTAAPAPAVPSGPSGADDEVMIEHVEDTTDSEPPYVPQEVTGDFHSDLVDKLNQASTVAREQTTQLYSAPYDQPPTHLPAQPSSAWEEWNDAPHFRWAKKGWLSTRMLAVRDEMGVGADYLLPDQVWDYEVEVAVPGDKYPHWGNYVLDGGAELTTGEVQMMRQSEEQPTQPSPIDQAPSTSSPARSAGPSPLQSAIETASLSELRAARPHPALFFNPVDRSWVLIARAPPRLGGDPTGPSTARNTWRPCEVAVPRLQKLGLPVPIQPARVASDDVQPGLPEVEWDLYGAGRQEVKVWEGHEGDDVLVSQAKFFPLVIREELWLALEDESQPKPGDATGVVGFFRAVQMIWRVLDGLLFLGKGKSLPVWGKGFSKAIAWSPTAHAIFVDTLGFIFHDSSSSITPPSVDSRTEEGRANRARLLRAWLEAGLMIESAKKNDPASLPTGSANATRLNLGSPQPALKAALGGHDIPRRGTTANDWVSVGPQVSSLDPAVEQYDLLGASPDVSDEAIVRLYETQLEFHPTAGPTYLGALAKIGQARNSDEIQTIVALERSQGKLAQEEIDAAYAQLGAEPSWTEDQLGEAFMAGMDQAANNERKEELRAMFGIVAKLRDSDLMRSILSSMEEVAKPQMTLAQAYRMFDLPEDTPDDAVEGGVELMYGIMMADNPFEEEKLKEAVLLIAETKNLAGLRRLVGAGEGGQSGGDSMALVPFGQQQHKEDEIPLRIEGRPVGLANIANTCYLNSLLQYLFNVKQLREAILSFEPVPEGEEGDKEVAEVAEERRVGGRLVTKDEVKRANRFVILLQQLFRQLVESSLASVTPETELAYLALVTGNATYSAVGTANATAAADAPHAGSDAPPPLEPVTVRNNTPQPDAMDTDQPTPDLSFATTTDATTVSPPDAPPETDVTKSPSVLGKRRSSALESVDQAGDSLDELALASSPSAKTSGEEAGPSRGPAPAEADAPSITPTIGSPTPTPEAGGDPMEVDDSARVKRGKSTDDPSTPPLLDVDPPLAEADGAGQGALTAGQEEGGADGALPVQGPAPPPLPARPPTVDLEQEVSKAMAFGLQNDVTEAQDNVVFLIEASQGKRSFEGHAADKSVVKDTFYGKMQQILEFDDPSAVPDPVRTTTVPFLSLGVRVPMDPPGVTSRMSLYDGLDTVFEATAVTSEGHEAQLRSTLLETPSMLQIQLQRVDYDREERRVVKSNAHVAFPEVLCLDRYLDVDPADEVAVARQEAMRAKRQELELARLRLDKLGKGKETTGADDLRHLREWLTDEWVRDQMRPSDELMSDLETKPAEFDAEMIQLEKRQGEIKREMDELWADQRKARFGLVAVFIHRGTASSGHYYVYLKNCEDGKWYKYNDATITPVEEAEVFLQRSEGAKADTNAYFLGYERLAEGEEVAEERYKVGGPAAEAEEEQAKAKVEGEGGGEEKMDVEVQEVPAVEGVDWTVEPPKEEGVAKPAAGDGW